MTPIVRPRADEAPFTHLDLIVNSTEDAQCIVGRLSTWLDPDAADARLAQRSESELRRELDWAIHIGLPCVLLNRIPETFAHLAHVVQSVFKRAHGRSLWVRISAGDDATWQRWVAFRALCERVAGSMGVLLELPADLPPRDILDRWMGEPVRAVSLPASIFLVNAAGFPVLSRAHQGVLRSFFRLGIQVTVALEAALPDTIAHYRQYLDHLNGEAFAALSPESAVGRGFEDVLQSPLQPLQDNLESATYQVFERDRIKYVKYEEAITAALADRKAGRTEPLVLMVLGAGRGPLVDASLAASQATGVPLRVYCVEKNPNALLTLAQRQAHEWGDAVTVVGSDMRDWAPPELADIVVSELLGSFGDNELSPECLDGANRLIKPDGISIPHSYTSFLAPIMSFKLAREVRGLASASGGAVEDKAWETPYVCLLTNVHLLGEPQQAFSFTHPNRALVIDNSRRGTWHFTMAQDAVMHGLAGYFEAQLYGTVRLSTNPIEPTETMYSWFPIFFPIKVPLVLRGGDRVTVHMWRCVAKHQVWYEWAVSQPFASMIHNCDGRSSAIGL